MKKFLSILSLSVLCFSGQALLLADNTPPAPPKTEDESSSDWQITLKVKAAILADDTLSPGNRFVSVTTTDGVVTITGEVSTKYQKNEIVKKAESVAGVKRVEDMMTVAK